MKRLMTAALAATLMCGTAAFAQDATQTPAQTPGVTDTQSGNTIIVSNAPTGQPPADYPPCTHRGEDRCVVRGAGGAEHGKVHHHKKPKAGA